jgi:hypothetical protein
MGEEEKYTHYLSLFLPLSLSLFPSLSLFLPLTHTLRGNSPENWKIEDSRATKQQLTNKQKKLKKEKKGNIHLY